MKTLNIKTALFVAVFYSLPATCEQLVQNGDFEADNIAEGQSTYHGHATHPWAM